MSGISGWFREFWQRPVAARTIIIVLFLGITSLYCFGFASLVAGSRLRPTRAPISLATLTPETGVIAAVTTVVASATVAKDSVTATQTSTVTPSPTVEEVPTASSTPEIVPVIVHPSTQTPVRTRGSSTATVTGTRVPVGSRTPSRTPSPSTLGLKTVTPSPVLSSTKTVTSTPNR